mmetsp:Transcript_110608/g.263677  ORF Transcript_110608/g.263677 Transcript_110608/m.263677 type:complete len:291 (-) Transcript_110608:103-975(-)
MNRNHVGNLLNVILQLCLINPCGGLAHKRLSCAYHRGFCCIQDNHAKQTCAHWVRIVPLAHLSPRGGDKANIKGLQPNAQGRQAHPEGLNNVPNDMGQRGLDCHVVTVVGVAMIITAVRVPVTKNLHQHQVDSEPEKTDEEHNLPVNGSWLYESRHSLPKQHSGESPNDGYRKQSSQHFGLLEAEGVLRSSLHLRQLQGDEGHDEPTHIREHVCGICNDGKRIGNKSTNNLHGHEQQRKAHRLLQPGLIVQVALCVGHGLVRMAVAMSVAFAVAVAVAVTVAVLLDKRLL